MIEFYNGMYIRPRKLRSGGWKAQYGGGDLVLTTECFYGKGAKQKAIDQAQKEIDALTPEKIHQLLDDDYE